MAIHRIFNELKFKRTYLGGSRKKEKELIKKIQGTEENDYDDCDWFEFRRMLMESHDDTLQVIFSYGIVMKYLSHILGILVLPALFFSIIASLIVLGCSILCHVAFLILRHKQRNFLLSYDFVITLINCEIQRLTGLNLIKNY